MPALISSMFCLPKSSQEEELAKKQSDAIDRQLKIDAKNLKNQVKILLLGAGESGKSTVIKQMRLIHKGGFKAAERKIWRHIIFQNLVCSFLLLFELLDDGTQVLPPEIMAHYKLLANAKDIDPEKPLPANYLPCFEDLWDDQTISYSILKENQYAIHDNLHYFMSSENRERIFEPSFLPTDQDILRTRLQTTGINEEEFFVSGVTYRMFDVGGQKSERKKWFHAFDNTNVVLFLAAISGYDQTLPEDRGRINLNLMNDSDLKSLPKRENQMTDALQIFEQIVGMKWFEKSTFILFLNKMDLFREKLSGGFSSIRRNGWPDYKGEARDVEAGTAFFTKKFRDKFPADRELFIHHTNATDTSLLRITMENVQETIVATNVKDLIL